MNFNDHRIRTQNLTSETTQAATAMDKSFGFSSKGASIELVGISSCVEQSKRAQVGHYASELIASLGQSSSILKESACGAFVAGAASIAALGTIEPLAIGVGGMAGVISSISKGGRTA